MRDGTAWSAERMRDEDAAALSVLLLRPSSIADNIANRGTAARIPARSPHSADVRAAIPPLLTRLCLARPMTARLPTSALAWSLPTVEARASWWWPRWRSIVDRGRTDRPSIVRVHGRVQVWMSLVHGSSLKHARFKPCAFGTNGNTTPLVGHRRTPPLRNKSKQVQKKSKNILVGERHFQADLSCGVCAAVYAGLYAGLSTLSLVLAPWIEHTPNQRASLGGCSHVAAQGTPGSAATAALVAPAGRRSHRM
jgi:hypothetical protein